MTEDDLIDYETTDYGEAGDHAVTSLVAEVRDLSAKASDAKMVAATAKAEAELQRHRANERQARVEVLEREAMADAELYRAIVADRDMYKASQREAVIAWFDENKDQVVKDMGDLNGKIEAENDTLRAQLSKADEQATLVRNALTAAGVVDHEAYPDEPVDAWEASLRAGGRMVPAHERVERLAAERDALKALVDAATTYRVGDIEIDQGEHMKHDSLEVTVVVTTAQDILEEANHATSPKEFDELIKQATIALETVKRLRALP